MTRHAVWTLAALVAGLASFCVAAKAEDRPLVLEMVLNGRATGILGNFTDRNGALYATPAELSDLGFLVPATLSGSADPVALGAIPGIEATVNERLQTIVVRATDAVLKPQQLNGPRDFRQNSSVTKPMTGLVLNYDVLGTYANHQTSGGAEIDARLFSRYGVLSTTAQGLLSPTGGQRSVVRLESSWTYAEPESLRRWKVGDLITGGLDSSRPIRLGGFQLATDFSLRPDLVTFPLPQLSGSTLVPTTVDVLVNGVRQLSQPVTPGPFEIRSLPIVTGAGEVAIAVQDSLGRQTITRVPFYSSSVLLSPDLLSYSLEGGFVRQGFSQTSNDYQQAALVGTIRRGMTDWLTLEAHSELTSRLAMFGGGANVRIGSLGVVSLAGAGSSNSDITGWTASASAERNTQNYNISVSGTVATSGYRDIAGLTDATIPRLSFRISGGVPLGSFGSIGLAYISQRAFSKAVTNSGAGGANISLVTMSYQTQLADRLNFYATGYGNLRAQNATTGQASIGYGAMLGVSFAFGPNYGAGASVSNDGGRTSYVTQFNKSASEIGDYGLHLTDSEGFARRRLGEFNYNDGAGILTLGADQSGGTIATRGGFAGSLVVGGGSVYAAQTVSDSFAVVRTGDVEGVGVSYENRPIGQTDSSGGLLVPYLRAYQVNRITLNATDLPPDISAAKTDMYVRPPERSGVVVDFDVRSSNGALLRLQDSQGQVAPVGTVVNRDGLEPSVVGYDGEVYLTDLMDKNAIKLELPDGGTCGLIFPYKHVKGDLPVIGPLRCN